MRDFLRSPFTGTPRLRIHSRCTELIWEYGREAYPADQDGQPVKENLVDRFNHAQKALSYWLVDKFGVSDVERRKPEKGRDRFGRRGRER